MFMETGFEKVRSSGEAKYLPLLRRLFAPPEQGTSLAIAAINIWPRSGQ